MEIDDVEDLDFHLAEHLNAMRLLMKEIEKADKVLHEFLLATRALQPNDLVLGFREASQRLRELCIDREVVNTAISCYARLYREVRKTYESDESILVMDPFKGDYGIASLLFRDDPE